MPTHRSAIDRRTLLIGGGSALVLVIAGCRRDASGNGAADPPSTAIAASVRDGVDPGVLAVGRRYVDLHPDATIDGLVAGLPSGNTDPLAAAAAVVRDEFAGGETIVIDGWILARSEAMAAAAIVLACEDAAC